MKLQIALDLTTTEQAVALVEKTLPYIDIAEVGTPMIIREGMVPVRELKKRFPDLCVLADTKIVDGGALECADAVEAGADIITVLAFSDRQTVRDVVEVAHKAGRKVMADLIGIEDIPAVALEMAALDVDYICVHTGVDAQKSGRTPLGDLDKLLTVLPPEKTGVAGGISLKTVGEYAARKPGILIAGGALAGSVDPRQTAKDMKEAME
jgi:3-hexulose-6-phosphate synthase